MLASLAGVTREELESGDPDDILELRAELTMQYEAYQAGPSHGRTYSLESDTRTAYITITRNGDYQIVGVRVLLGRATDDEGVVCSTLSRLLTLALEHGVAVHEVVTPGFYKPPTDRRSNTGVFNELFAALSTILEEEAALDPDYLRLKSHCPVCGSLLSKWRTPHFCLACGYAAQP
ncbi:MAG: hypothetical protein WC314_25195 [Vulcanimicrobiota bacterium]